MDVKTDSIAPLRSLGFGFREGHANGISGPRWVLDSIDRIALLETQEAHVPHG
jgi:hypothetical protein